MKRRKKEIVEQTKTRLALPECWILEEGKYRHLKDGILSETLPVLDKEYAGVLEEKGIPYRIVEDVCEYWSKEFFQEQEQTLPVYQKEGEVYKYLHRYHTGNVQHELAIKKAEDVQAKLKRERPDIFNKEKNSKLRKKYKEIVSGKQGIEMKATITEEQLKILNQGGDLRVFAVKNNDHVPIGRFAIFSMEAIKGEEFITLEANPDYRALVIGKNGWQVKEWSQELGVKKINVV